MLRKKNRRREGWGKEERREQDSKRRVGTTEDIDDVHDGERERGGKRREGRTSRVGVGREWRGVANHTCQTEREKE